MKLENVDLTKLQVNNLPKFDKCPCELCDDGCFDRAGCKHHPECRRKLPKRTQLPAAYRCPLSHYKGTFLAATLPSGQTVDHRRQPCAPPPDNDILPASKNVPMAGLSSQKEHYPPPPTDALQQKIVKAPKQTSNLMLSRSVPMEKQTHYQTEFVEKPVLPVSLRTLKDPIKDSQVNITDANAPISSQTTTKAHFKSWNSAPSQPYTEMPPVVGHVLFPGSNRAFDTTTGVNHVPFINVALTKPIVRLDLNGNLRTSGTMDLRTNYRQEFVNHELPSKSSPAYSAKEVPTTNQHVYTRRPMNGISQTSFDFRPYPKHRPPLPIENEPFQSQVQIGNSYSQVEKDSKYRTDYPGHDVSQHPRQAAVAPKDNQQSYVAPSQKMDSLTVNQRDFPPIDIGSLPRIRITPLKSNLSISDQTGPMESMTMSRYHYQPYENVGSRRNFGELLPSVYIPPLEKFQATTTTGETYQGRTGPPARPYIPEIQSINRAGTQDHNTSYRVDYHPHGLSLCAAKAYAIAQKQQASTETVPVQ